MARKSRYANSENTVKRYKAALYIRLSNDDDDKKAESNSVVNQKKLLTNFVNNISNIEIYDYYIDDGYTGINFNRPAFGRMIRDISKHSVNCVIVKDLSRLGRNYVDVGNYIDKFFPENNIRFIAVNDAVDNLGSEFDMIVPIKNIFNENYSRDISKKVTSAFKVKELNGEFIGAFASYGYMKDPKNRNKLIIDPYASEIVKKIYSMFLNGTAKIQIAKELNSEGVVCPSEYKKQSGLKYSNGNRLELTKYWTYSTVHRILQNEIYAGTMVQHKNVRKDFKSKHSAVTDKSDWIKVKGTHEAIIDYDTWNAVQDLMQKDTRQIDFQHNIHMFAGFVKCGDCGRAMAKVKRHGKYELVCGSYMKFGRKICTQHKIPYDLLEKIVLAQIQALIREMVDLESAVRNAEEESSCSRSDNKRIASLKQQLDRVLFLKKGLYEDYRGKILSHEEYMKYKSDYETEAKALRRQIEALEKSDQTPGKELVKSEWFRSLKKFRNIQKLDRMTIAAFIDQIKIYENKHVEIIFRQMDKVNRLHEYK